jgi:hypothetical protein
LLLFTSPDAQKPPVDPATKHTHGDVEVIGPVHVETPPEQKKKP